MKTKNEQPTVHDYGNGEDNILPTPKWINKLGHEIADKYKLGYVDGIYISGMICKAIRINIGIHEPNSNNQRAE